MGCAGGRGSCRAADNSPRNGSAGASPSQPWPNQTVLLLRIHCQAVFLCLLIAATGVPGQSLLPGTAKIQLPADPIVAPPGYSISHLWQVMGFLPRQFLENNRFETLKFVGVTSLVSYVHWSEVEPNGPDDTTFDTYIGLRAKLHNHGLRWIPILVANPFYSTPEWFRNSDLSVFARCLEHDRDTPVQSIWNPYLRPHVRRFMRKVAEYCHRQRDSVEVVRLGICGNFGEAAFPSALGLDLPDSTHIHQGWWAGDAYARQDFRRWLKRRHGGVKGVATAWVVPATAVDRIATATGNLISLPREALAGRYIRDASGLDEVHRHRFQDFVTWYQESMTDYARQWLEDARNFFPGERLELIVPGDGRLQSGADLVALTKVAREFQAGLWCIAMSDDFLSGFAASRLVSSAARAYGAFYGTEEHIQNTEAGISGRFFAALSGGATSLGFRGLFDTGSSWGTALPRKALETYCQNLPLLRRSKPVVPMAIVYPNTRMRIYPHFIPIYQAWLKRLRDTHDFDLAEETMIRDGLLKRFRVVVRLPMCELPEDVETAIREFVEDGGVEIVHAGQASRDEVVDPVGRTKTIAFRKIGGGYRAVYGLPSEREYSDFSPRLHLLLSGKRLPWEGVLSPDGRTDGVYSTLLSDGSIAVYNALDLSAKVTVRAPGQRDQDITLDPLELRLLP